MSFDTTYADSEGPFLFYFQLDYDMMQEGVVGLVLSQYDPDRRSFREVALYEMLDQQSVIVQIIEKGSYVVSVQPIASRKSKFGMIGDSSLHRGVQSQCFLANYTYFINSMQVSQSEDMYVDLILSFFGW